MQKSTFARLKFSASFISTFVSVLVFCAVFASFLPSPVSAGSKCWTYSGGSGCDTIGFNTYFDVTAGPDFQWSYDFVSAATSNFYLYNHSTTLLSLLDQGSHLTGDIGVTIRISNVRNNSGNWSGDIQLSATNFSVSDRVDYSAVNGARGSLTSNNRSVTLSGVSLGGGAITTESNGYYNFEVAKASWTDAPVIPVTPVIPAPTVNISVSPTAVQFGSNANISWASTNANSCVASGDWSGAKALSGSEQSGTFWFGGKTFTITCTGAGGNASASAGASMYLLPSDPTVRWTSNPSSSGYGNSYFISAEGSDSDGDLVAVSINKNGVPFAYADGGNGSSGSTGNTTSDTGPRTVTYTAWTTDSRGATSPLITHTVIIGGPAPVNLTFTGTPNNVSYWTGGTITLSWTAQNADSCVASDDWSGAKAVSGTQNVYIFPFSSPQTYSLTCHGAAGDDSGSVTVNVGNTDLCPNIAGKQETIPVNMHIDESGNCVNNAPVAPSVVVAASPKNLGPNGGSVTISWGTTDASSCTASGGWSGSKGLNGSETVSVTATTVFNLSCTGSGGVGSGSDTVTVAGGPVVAGNNITYNSYSGTVTAGQRFNVSVTNSGTKVWGSNHNLGISTSDLSQNTYFADLGTTLSGGQKTVSMLAPNAPGNYVLRAVEQGVEWFGPNQSFTVTPAPIQGPSVSLSSNSSCVPPNSSVTITSVVNGAPINSNIIQKDSPAANSAYGDGVFGTIADYGSSGGTHSLSVGLGGEGYYDFKAIVNGSLTAGVRVQSLASCSSAPINTNPNGNNPNGSGGGPVAPPTVFGCTDPLAVNFNPSANTSNGSCRYPSFTLSANPSSVKAKSLAGYSGVTEQEIQLSINPVNGFNKVVTVRVASFPVDTKPEFSFDGGSTYSTNPTATLSWDGSSYYRVNGTNTVYVPVKIRFLAKLAQNGNYPIVFQAIGGNINPSPTATVMIDSKPLYPGFQEI